MNVQVWQVHCACGARGAVGAYESRGVSSAGGAGASNAFASGGGGGASGMLSLGTTGFSAVINDPDGTISAAGVVAGVAHVSVVGGRPAFRV